MVLIHRALLTAVIVFEARIWLHLKGIWPLMAAGIAGMPLGTYLLVVLDVSMLKAMIGGLAVMFALAFLAGFRKRVERERAAFAPVGLVSDLLGSSTISNQGD